MPIPGTQYFIFTNFEIYFLKEGQPDFAAPAAVNFAAPEDASGGNVRFESAQRLEIAAAALQIQAEVSCYYYTNSLQVNFKASAVRYFSRS